MFAWLVGVDRDLEYSLHLPSQHSLSIGEVSDIGI